MYSLWAILLVGKNAEKFFILHYFIFKRGLTDNRWRKGLLLNVFQTAGRLMEPERLIKLAVGWQIYTMYTSATNGVKSTLDDTRVTVDHCFSFLFLWPFSFETIPWFLHLAKQKNHTKTNKCTGCVNTKYRGDGEGLTFTFLFFFCMEAIDFISITT